MSPAIPAPPADSSRASGRARVAASMLAFAASTALTVAAGFLHLFTLLAPWDDEGYLLVSLRAFLRGERLYDEVYTQYGPFWFEAMGALFGLTGLEVSHDHGRLVTLGAWTLAALACGLAAAFAARSTLAGVLVQLLVFRVVWPSLALEPMHPGSLVCLLLAGLALTAPVGARRPALAGVLQGAVAAALLLVKINVGAFALLALATGAIPGLVAAGRRTLAVLVTASGALLPFALMARDLDLSWARAYALLGSLSALAVALALHAVPDVRPLSRRHLAGLATGLLASASAIVLVVLGLGSSWSALVEAVLVAPRRQASALTLPPSVPGYATVVTVLAFLACVLALWRARRKDAAHGGRAVVAAALARLGVATLFVLSTTGALEPRWPSGFWFACLAWVAVLRPHDSDDLPALSALRRLVPPLAALQVLHAYPVAGSQVAWSSFLLVLVALLCALDGTRQLGAWVRSRGSAVLLARFRLPALAGALLLVLVVSGFAAPLARMRQAHAQLPALGLPGAHLLHLPRQEVRMLHELVEKLATRCDTFVTLPGLNSLYLWSEKEPPTGFNATTWMFLFDDALQARIVARLETIERLCLVRQPRLAEAWAGGRPVPERPLLVYLRERFEFAERVGEYELWVRTAGPDPPGR